MLCPVNTQTHNARQSDATSNRPSQTECTHMLAADVPILRPHTRTLAIYVYVYQCRPFVALTCSTTSTAYELPFDFWEPSKRDPLYSSVRETPSCLELAGGGGVISAGTGIMCGCGGNGGMTSADDGCWLRPNVPRVCICPNPIHTILYIVFVYIFGCD